LRILAMRFGDPTPGSAAELQANVDLSTSTPKLDFTGSSFAITVLPADPTGPGRLITTPGAPPLQYDWFACIGPLSLYSPGSLDPQCGQVAPGDPPLRQNPGLYPFIASGPIQGNPSLTLQTSQLMDLAGEFLQAALTPGGDSSGSGVVLPMQPIQLLVPIVMQVSIVGSDLTSSQNSEAAYNFLRITIALPGMTLPPPNHNPMLPAAGGVLFAPMPSGPNTQLPPCSQPSWGNCQQYPVTRTDPVYVTGAAAPGSIETYNPLDGSGRMNVTETMRYAWFSSDGTFDDERTGDANPQTAWQNSNGLPAPPQVQVVDLWLIVQDERGGADYQRFQMAFPQ
jgi:hypothetical protein